MSQIPLSLAVAHYDRHVPFLDSTVGVDGVQLRVLEVGQSIPGRDGQGRHEQMLRHGAFDAAEVSLSSYLMAREQHVPVIAIPVVPRRLFSASLFFCRTDAPLQGPLDLAGKRVGINTYQTTLSVLAKGDLEHEYGVPWKGITWVINAEETFPFAVPDGVRIERLAAGQKIDALLLNGEIDAAILPHPPSSLIGNSGQVRRVFPDARNTEQEYFRKNGYWPIMHLIALRQEVVDRHPWVPRAFFDAYLRAMDAARRHYEDPNWSLLVWGRHYLDQERALLGGDPWGAGVAAIRQNLMAFMRYSVEQGLLASELPVASLFHPSVLDT